MAGALPFYRPELATPPVLPTEKWTTSPTTAHNVSSTIKNNTNSTHLLQLKGKNLVETKINVIDYSTPRSQETL